MIFRADEYFQAGVERMAQARSVYQLGNSYALAIYCGGLAVECILRAFRWKKDTSFEGRHDLNDLLRASGFINQYTQMLREKAHSEESIEFASAQLIESANRVVFVWHNNLRYASEKSLRAHLRRLDKLRGIKGDPLKKNAQDLLTAAGDVVERGKELWNFDAK